jgi:hypothetical protein
MNGLIPFAGFRRNRGTLLTPFAKEVLCVLGFVTFVGFCLFLATACQP